MPLHSMEWRRQHDPGRPPSQILPRHSLACLNNAPGRQKMNFFTRSKAGIHLSSWNKTLAWVPAFAGTTLRPGFQPVRQFFHTLEGGNPFHPLEQDLSVGPRLRGDDAAGRISSVSANSSFFSHARSAGIHLSGWNNILDWSAPSRARRRGPSRSTAC
jgi:hypothetical protein